MMRWRSRMGVLPWPILFIGVAGWLVFVSSVAEPAAATPAAIACSVSGHRMLPCCEPRSPGRSVVKAPRCVVGLTIASNLDPSTDGQVVTISGRLREVQHAHALVRLWRRLPGSRRFYSTALTRTSRSGAYSMTVRVDANRWWYVTAAGLRSHTVHQRVRALITLACSETRAAPGTPVTFTGTVAPSHAGEQVVVQERGPTGWQPITQGVLDRASTYSIDYTFSADGTFQLRAYLRRDRRNINSYSASVPGSVNASLTPPVTVAVNGIFKIQHVVVIMQENRSFDQYFGTYPGADGIPGLAGNPGTVPCVPDPEHGGCVQPFHDTNDVNYGGPHTAGSALADMDCTQATTRTGCKMDGFVAQAEKGGNCTSDDPNCSPCTTATHTQCIDAMGYHDASEIPNYWTYAQNFVLQDHIYESAASWSLPEHLYLVSGWSASCANPMNPFSCTNSLDPPQPSDGQQRYAWTDITYLLHLNGVSWGYYVSAGTEPDCESGAMTCAAVSQNAKTPGIWNPLPSFTDVTQDDQLGNIQPLSNFFAAAQSGTLPAVSWIAPNGTVSEHPPALVSAGQRYVTGLINAIMESPDWDSTAIFLSWDDWGGFYDQVVPPVADEDGYGLRVPGIVISPYAKTGMIDSQTLSQDAYLKFIEDDFLGGQRLDPATDGRPDPRPDVREDSPLLGDLTADFDFAQQPRAPLILSTCPSTDLTPPPSC